MLIKTVLLGSAVLILSSCNKAPKPEITTLYCYSDLDILHNQVKQLTEIYRGGKSDKYDTLTTDFDAHGNSIQTKCIGSDNYLVKYEYRYDKSGRKTELIETGGQSDAPYIYKFDTIGRIAQKNEDPKALKPDPYNQLLQEKFFYRYNAAGDRIQEDDYLDEDHLSRITYKYDYKHLLLEEDYFRGDDEKTVHKTFYHYTSFDSKGNWLRRVGKVKNDGLPMQEIIEPVVVRKISYY